MKIFINQVTKIIVLVVDSAETVRHMRKEEQAKVEADAREAATPSSELVVDEREIRHRLLDPMAMTERDRQALDEGLKNANRILDIGRKVRDETGSKVLGGIAVVGQELNEHVWQPMGEIMAPAMEAAREVPVVGTAVDGLTVGMAWVHGKVEDGLTHVTGSRTFGEAVAPTVTQVALAGLPKVPRALTSTGRAAARAAAAEARAKATAEAAAEVRDRPRGGAGLKAGAGSAGMEQQRQAAVSEAMRVARDAAEDAAMKRAIADSLTLSADAYYEADAAKASVPVVDSTETVRHMRKEEQAKQAVAESMKTHDAEVARLNAAMTHSAGPPLTAAEVLALDRGLDAVDLDVAGVASITKAALAAAARKVGASVVAAVSESGVWKLGPVVRGEVIEQALGQNLPKAFPVVDRLKDGVVTSIKSIDLKAPTYLDAGRLSTKLRSYVDKVAKFEGKKFDGQDIKFGRDFTRRALDVAVPSKGTPGQQGALQQAIDYAKTKGVDLNVTIFP